MTKLVMRQGQTVVGEYPLLKPVVTIGRKSDNDFRIDNPAVSGHHARVVKEGDSFIIEDLGSTNGTFLGTKRIKEQVLADGMEITIGKYVLCFMSEAVQPETEDQATVFIAPRQHAAAGQTPNNQQRVRHEASDDNGRMILIVLSGAAIAVGVFVALLWLSDLL